MHNQSIQGLCEGIVHEVPAFQESNLGCTQWAQQIQSVLSALEPESIHRNGILPQNSTRYALQYGSKVLSVAQNESDNSFSTYVRTKRRKHQEKETTILYAAARLLMQMIVDEKRRAMHYCFCTKFQKLKLWSRRTGERIFHWGQTFQDNENLLVQVSVIRPSERRLLSQ